MNQWLTCAAETAAFLADALPEAYRIALFDLTDQKLPVAASYRMPGKVMDLIRAFLRQILKNPSIVENGKLTRRGDVIARGRMYSTSVQLIKDPDGRPVGALVLMMDATDLMGAYAMMTDLLTFRDEELEDIASGDRNASQELTLEVIDRMVSEYSDEPARMTPDERNELLLDLYDTGVFDLKGAVSHAAFCLEMSEQSVYRYLSKIRRARGD